MRSPVPQSRMNCVPSGAISSRQGVFPPYRHVAGSTVGVDPRTPQKLNLAIGTVIALSAKPLCKGLFRTGTRGTGNLFHGRSRWQGASINSPKRSVILPNKQGKGLHRHHRARRIGRMAAHSHDHSHAGHSHSPGHSHAGHAHPTLRPSVLGWAMAATLGLVVAEVFGGILGRSVALLNDAVHNLSDVPALGISYLAMRWAERPAQSAKTYGYHRAGTLAAFTNAFVLVLLSLWLGY